MSETRTETKQQFSDPKHSSWVPDPTSKDWSLARIGFDAWYKHDSRCDPKTGNPNDWRDEVLALLRLAKFYRDRLSWMYSKFSETDEYRNLEAGGETEIEKLKTALGLIPLKTDQTKSN